MVHIVSLNTIALRMIKTLWSFGPSECNRINSLLRHVMYPNYTTVLTFNNASLPIITESFKCSGAFFAIRIYLVNRQLVRYAGQWLIALYNSTVKTIKDNYSIFFMNVVLQIRKLR